MKLKLPKVKIPKANLAKVKSLKIPRIRKINLTTVLALLSYLHVLVIIPLLLSKNNSFVRFHAKQGLILLIVWTVGLFSIYVPLLPWIVFIFIIVCVIFGIINVFLSRERFLPLVGRLAKNF